MEALAADDPRQIGGFRLQARLGAGGMGRVYLGYSPGGRPVAIKVVHPDLARDPEFMQRFRREVSAAQAVSDAYTAAVVGAGPDDSPPWLATTYVPGPPLANLVSQAGPLPESAVWRLVGGLAEALEAIHAQGLVHRDLKPGNILIAADGPRVIDFGISRTTGGTVVTATHTAIGTPAYMSPEQAQGLPVGPASDVFSLGSVLAFAATGTSPFGSGEAFAIGFKVVHGEPDLSRVPLSLRPMISACLAKDPAARPQLRRLMQAVNERTASYPDVTPGRFWPDQVAAVLESPTFSLALPPLTMTPPPVPTTDRAVEPLRYEPTVSSNGLLRRAPRWLLPVVLGVAVAIAAGIAIAVFTSSPSTKTPPPASFFPSQSASPAAGSATNPATQPATNPATNPATQPATNPATNPATSPATNPATQPATSPATSPVTGSPTAGGGNPAAGAVPTPGSPSQAAG